MSWWDTDIVAREVIMHHVDLEREIEGDIVRWDIAWGLPPTHHVRDDDTLTRPPAREQHAIDCVYLPGNEPLFKEQRRHALLQLQGVAFRRGFGYQIHLDLPRLGFGIISAQYVKLVAQPD